MALAEPHNKGLRNCRLLSICWLRVGQVANSSPLAVRHRHKEPQPGEHVLKFSCRRALVIILLSALAAASGELAGSAASVQPGDKERRFTEFETGGIRTLQHYREKILILNFWATWCKPCLEEMPLLVSIQERYAEKGVQVVAVSADQKDTQNRIRPFLDRFKVNFPIWLRGTTEHMEELGLGRALPATAIIDRTGRVVGRIMGKAEETDLTRYIDWLLAAPPDSIDRLNEEKAHHDDEHEHEHPDGSHSHEHIGLEGASRVPS